MSFVWTIAEQFQGSLKPVSFELLGWGRKLADKLGTKLASVIIGNGIDKKNMAELIYHGADEVYAIQDPRLGDFVCESYANIIADLVNSWHPSIILAAASSIGRTLMPYLAVQIHTGLTADCTELDIEPETGHLLQTRPAIGGNIMATIKTPDHKPQMATVRPKSGKPLPADSSRQGKIISVNVAENFIESRVKVKGYRNDTLDFVNLEDADVVIAGGKGMKKAENFHLLREVAAYLGGVIGASRDAVDRGWLAYPHQIGLSGKTISSKLYLCAGISGSIQHLAGIKTCETIVSINNDPEANIHRIADYAIVGDLFEVLPELKRRLAERAADSSRTNQAVRSEIS
jgi:electron transfer flavoprotein alpha subunit